ncbi:MAG: SRPBCC domain-containing protein [Thermodesulfobacteriota bacterium]
MPEPKARAQTARVVVLRTVRGTPDLVFRCFTEPSKLVEWFGPGEARCVDARVDLRVGGRYRFEFRSPEGERSVVGGVFREIDAPRRLRFSWIWEVWKTVVPAETLVTVELRPLGHATEVKVTHEGFPDAWTREQHAAGWAATLDCLEPLLRSKEKTT